MVVETGGCGQPEKLRFFPFGKNGRFFELTVPEGRTPVWKRMKRMLHAALVPEEIEIMTTEAQMRQFNSMISMRKY